MVRLRRNMLALAALVALAPWVGRSEAAGPLPGDAFRDCPDCPEMVVVPPGRFRMGSTAAETTREKVETQYAAREQPLHDVAVPRAFALGRSPVTYAEFGAFVRETGYDPSGCWVWDAAANKPKRDERKSWRDPVFPQASPRQPVVCVSWVDAQAYVAWLSARTGQSYRLPSEAEWEYAARAGTQTARWWGEDAGTGRANCGGCGSIWDNRQTSPVGSFPPNPFGLYDMLGNVWQWTADCWTETHTGAPADGSARTDGNCKGRVVRGGSWVNPPKYVRAAYRIWADTDLRNCILGFRVARTLQQP